MIVTVYSSDLEHDGDVVGAVAASAALTISDIPFEGPIAEVRVGRINGPFAGPSTMLIGGRGQDGGDDPAGDRPSRIGESAQRGRVMGCPVTGSMIFQIWLSAFHALGDEIHVDSCSTASWPGILPDGLAVSRHLPVYRFLMMRRPESIHRALASQLPFMSSKDHWADW